jgi:DNA mismatch repair protein MutS2
VKSKKKTVNTPLVEEFVKYLKVEKSKIEDGIVKEKATFPKVVQKKKKIKPEQDTHQRHRIVVGSQVKLIENRKSGTVEKIEGDNITVLFGFIRMKVDREKLTWIQ